MPLLPAHSAIPTVNPDDPNASTLQQPLRAAGKAWRMVRVGGAGDRFERLPRVLKILAENVARRSAAGLHAFDEWLARGGSTDREVEFYPGRVLTHDTTCVPALVDIATMRDEAARRGYDPALVNPHIPVDLVIDHSVIVDKAGTGDAFQYNLARDFERNAERYAFVRWAQKSLDNFRVTPPATGILHQVNLECLTSIVRVEAGGEEPLLVPDTLVGTDSHTPMVNALGVLAWGVGGLEGEAAALGQPLMLRLPEVVGIRLLNRLGPGVSATDLALAMTERLRSVGVVDKMLEFFGPGVSALSVADRATVSNMAPEYGATCSLFPIDERTLEYLTLVGKDAHQRDVVEAYAKAQGLWHSGSEHLLFTERIDFDLAGVETSVAGPKRPQDRLGLSQVRSSFLRLLGELPERKEKQRESVTSSDLGQVQDGAVLIAAITSCTNTSNPQLMLAAALLARNARRRGLTVPPWVKTSLAPGSHAVTEYLEAAGLQSSLDALGFQLVGYGCTTCIGNSGGLDAALEESIAADGLVGAAVLSGNRNFEGRINSSIRAAYLASPALVVAYALSGSVLMDLSSEPLGVAADGTPVFLRDLWPDDEEVEAVIREFVTPALFKASGKAASAGTPEWQAIMGDHTTAFPWCENSTYLRRPPYFEDVAAREPAVNDLLGARALLVLGDSITTDHISPAGTIPVESATGEYLLKHGVKPANFNQYSTRRGNHEVMLRGLFSNPGLRNEILSAHESGTVRTLVDGEELPIYEAIKRYRAARTPLVLIAGKEYGGGSSRDWAAKGPALAGVRAVIAESFERIHRSNLVGMGILPLKFEPGVTRHRLRLNGNETLDLLGLGGELQPMQKLTLRVHRENGVEEDFRLLLGVHTSREVEYLRHHGLLPYVLQRLIDARKT